MLTLMLATFCAATLNVFWALGELSTPWTILTETITIHVNQNFFRPRTRIVFAVILLLCAATLWLRTRKSFVVSAVMLACVEFAYANWVLRTYRGVINAAVSDYSTIQHLAYLGGANWLDVFVWVGSTIVLVWVLVILARTRVGWREKMSLT